MQFYFTYDIIYENIFVHCKLDNCYIHTDYFSENGQADSNKIKDLIREIEIGLWDNYLFYDYESFTNIQAQHNLANVVQSIIMLNQQQVNNVPQKTEIAESN